MSCVIENATNVYCSCAEEVCFLINPSNTQRINKSEIQSYEPIDVLPNYEIHFMMKNGMIVVWTFIDFMSRDAALANVDAEMNTQIV
jgi:hypothetical protein